MEENVNVVNEVETLTINSQEKEEVVLKTKKQLRAEKRNLRKTPEYQRSKIDKILSKQKIRYRGPLSYRSIRIFAYFFMLLAQVVLIFSFVNKVTTTPDWLKGLMNVFDISSAFALPLFLTANFCVIMSSKKSIKNFLIFYSAFALLIYLALVLISYRYIGGFASIITDGNAEETATLTESITNLLFGKVINYNIFVDLSLFSFFFFFFFYTPKNIKSKKTMLIFRLCSLIPVLIIVASTTLYGLYYYDMVSLPVAALAIMPCRSFTIYAIFFALSFLIKLRKYRFLKMGGTEMEYEEYSKSNRSSLEISVIASILVVISSAIEFLLLYVAPEVLFFGIGYNFYYIFIIPFILLLSYTRKPKFKIVDTLMPLVFVILTFIVYLEGILILFQSI